MNINGKLVFDASASSEIQNLRIQKVSTNPSHGGNGSGDVGRLIFNTTDGIIYVGSATTWVAVATGGDASALLTEVNAIETSLGGMVNSSGVFQGSVFTTANGTIWATEPTSLTNALDMLADYVSGADTIAELKDVTITAAAAGDFLMHNGTAWVDHVLVAADLTDVTATAAELNILDGATLSTTELNYVDGVTSGIQGQLDAKQDEDATLTALAGLSGTGILVETGVDTFTHRTLVAPAAGITIADAGGVAGNPTFALANDLAALEGLATTGYVIRTGDGTATTRSISGTAGNVVVTNGDGVSSNTSINLDTVTPGSGGTFQKFTIDAFGRISAVTNVVAGDITALVDSAYVNVGGDTMTGTLTFSSGTVTGLPAPSGDTDAVNKAYVDAMTNGLSWKDTVRVASTANVVIASALENGDVIDGVTLVTGDRVLLKDQTAPAENGIYVVQATGAAVRAADMNQAAEFDGAAVFVQEGTANQGSGWTETATVTTVDTDAVTFSQFTGGALYTWGVGLSNSGNTISVNLGSGIFEQGSDAVGIELHDASNGAIILTDDGSARAITNSSKLHLLLDAAGALAQTSAGLKIGAAAVTNAMLVNDSITTNADSGGDGDLALGGTLEIAGTSVQGITTAVSGAVFTVSAMDASTSQKGVASFAAAEFDVASGAVSIKDAGVLNAHLANSSVTVTGTTGSDVVALGESLAIVGGAGGEVSTVMGTNSLAISVRDATTTVKGVASFAAADFAVTAGEVTAVAKGLDSLTDVTITSPSAGQILVNDGAGQFVNKKAYFLYDTVSGTPAPDTSHTVTHNIGQKYCNVTVVDSTDNVVIPESIVFNSNNQLTVTFNSAIACRVIVMGIA